MSLAKLPGAVQRVAASQDGSFQPPRLLRRAVPYPPRDLTETVDSFDGGEQTRWTCSVSEPGLSARLEGTQADRRRALYLEFYRQVQEDQRTPDCVVLSVFNTCLAYPESLGEVLRERGLKVDVLYLQSGLSRALQELQAEGAPLCLVVEQANVSLCSCTLIEFSDPLRVHRNMPREQALDLVQSVWQNRQVDPGPDAADVGTEASRLLGDFLDRERKGRHRVPADTRQLLRLLAMGVHLSAEELDTVSEYVRARRDHLRGSSEDGEKLLPQTLSKPPPLLPIPPRLDLPRPGPLLPTPGPHLRSKPPPLLSLHRAPRHPPGPLLPTPAAPSHRTLRVVASSEDSSSAALPSRAATSTRRASSLLRHVFWM